jgi:hypothetical protein
MFARPFATLLVIAALVGAAFAQEQRGSIEGVVRDARALCFPGAPLTPRPTWSAVPTSPTRRRITVPVTAAGQLQGDREPAGFSRREVVDVRVGLGQIKKVDFACRCRA